LRPAVILPKSVWKGQATVSSKFLCYRCRWGMFFIVFCAVFGRHAFSSQTAVVNSTTVVQLHISWKNVPDNVGASELAHSAAYPPRYDLGLGSLMSRLHGSPRVDGYGHRHGRSGAQVSKTLSRRTTLGNPKTLPTSSSLLGNPDFMKSGGGGEFIP